MHQRLLLGTTALVGASMMFTSAAMAQDGGLEVVLGGFTEFGGAAASNDTLGNQSKNQNYNFYMDSEIHVRVNGLTDGGIRYGSKVELEVGANNGDSNASIDEVGLFFSGNFGRVELGRDDGAEDLMHVGAEDAQAGTGGIDGDTANLNNVTFQDTGDSVKATYFTPRIAGFQAGFSWTPDGDDNSNGPGNTQLQGGDGRKDIAGGGVNWVGVLGPVDLTAFGGRHLCQCQGQQWAAERPGLPRRPEGLHVRWPAGLWRPQLRHHASVTSRVRGTPVAVAAATARSCRSALPTASVRPMSVSATTATGTTTPTTATCLPSVATSDCSQA